MPLVTAPPIQLTPQKSRQAGNGINPFIWKVGSKVYQLAVDGTAARVLLSTDGGNTWVEQDAANHQSGTVASAFFNPSTGILYILAGTSNYVVYAFNTNTNLYGATSAASAVGNGVRAAFYQKSDGSFVVLTANINTLSYLTLSALSGSWSGKTAIGSGSETVYGVVVDSSDVGYLVWSNASGDLLCASFSAANALGTPQTLAVGAFFDGVSTDQRIWSNQVVVTWTGGTGSNDNELQVGISALGLALSFTTYTVDTVAATGAINYPALAQDINGNLVVFGAWTDYSGTPIIDELLQWTFDGVSSWGSSTLFYDEVANPPASSVPQIDQFIHTGGAVQLPDGSWVYSTALEIGPTCTGFALVSPPLAPALSIACPVGGSAATIGVPYSKQLVVTGGTPPYSFEFV